MTALRARGPVGASPHSGMEGVLNRPLEIAGLDDVEAGEVDHRAASPSVCAWGTAIICDSSPFRRNVWRFARMSGGPTPRRVPLHGMCFLMLLRGLKTLLLCAVFAMIAAPV